MKLDTTAFSLEPKTEDSQRATWSSVNTEWKRVGSVLSEEQQWWQQPQINSRWGQEDKQPKSKGSSWIFYLCCHWQVPPTFRAGLPIVNNLIKKSLLDKPRVVLHLIKLTQTITDAKCEVTRLVLVGLICRLSWSYLGSLDVTVVASPERTDMLGSD